MKLEKKAPLSERFAALNGSIWGLLLPVIVVGGIYTGAFTPTEAAAVGTVYALFSTFVIYRTLSVKDLPGILMETVGTSAKIIANMIEIHANATPFAAGVYLSSCDKGVPRNLMGMFRGNGPTVFVPGGTMNAGPDMLTLEQLGMYSAKFERGEIDEEKLDWAKCNACPSCGACSFIGTASTMQIMAEALGLTLPGSALMPATSPELHAYARDAGRL